MSQPGYGLGRWRGPETIADHLAPGQDPQPSTGYQGPSIAIPQEQYVKMNEAIDKLGRALAQTQGLEDVVNVATASTDSAGTAYLGIYNVAAGIEARLVRLTVNAVNPSTGAGYTAASTYSNASAYLSLHQAESPNSNSVAGSHGSLIDFAPPTVGGPIFPGLFSDGSTQSGFVRGPAWFVLHVNAGPASTLVVARYQVQLRRLSGVA